jgi:antitoxin ParD1/3/4
MDEPPGKANISQKPDLFRYRAYLVGLGAKRRTAAIRSEHEQFIQSQLTSARCANVDKGLAQAFQLLEIWQQQDDEWQTVNRQKVAIGLQQIECGEAIDRETVMASLQEK